ncbi:MAG: carboxypeptidase M32 [Planctomycetota bacterium]|nr:MAG: carboxypeptidase M32 [Planctomycetota bacterium]
MTTLPAHYTELCRLRREAATLGAVSSLASWDQETYMPNAAADGRAEQSAMLAELVHERATSPRVGELISLCESDAELQGDARIAANIREMRRDYDLATKLPPELVKELAETGSKAQHVWKEARAKSDFALFRPWLEKMVTLARRKAECYGTPEGGELYDALLNEYEPDARSAEVEKVFASLRERLSALIGELSSKGTPPSEAPLQVHVSSDRQHALGLKIIAAFGFDLDAGRLDVTTHPFCSGLGPGDTRLTTRYREDHWTDALFGTMHECGHGLYEQGLPKKDGLFGQPLAQDTGLGIHESQSRMWENFVGRSRAFWEWAFPVVNGEFGGALDAFGVEDVYRAVNTARPSLIRVEADEATYNLHIMLRFELERALISGDLKVADVPGEWNRRFTEYLGIEVPDDARGCLQDVHWSFGLMGYFATYALGNLYAAQFWEKIRMDISGLDDQFRRGEFGALLDWLRTNIHSKGRQFRAAALCEQVTGKPLEADPLLRHLEGKLRPIHGV